MATIFNDCNGGVLRVNNCAPGATASIIPAIAVENFIETPITGFTLDLGTNHQFLHTLDEFIYLYAFGDRIGELTLSGISFAGTCVRSESGAQLEKKLAPNNVLAYYNENKVSRPAGPEPTFITIGDADKVLLGFLTGMRLDMPNPNMPIVQWVLRYNVILDNKNIPASIKNGGSRTSGISPIVETFTNVPIGAGGF